jgi:hypothetical protein
VAVNEGFKLMVTFFANVLKNWRRQAPRKKC